MCKAILKCTKEPPKKYSWSEQNPLQRQLAFKSLHAGMIFQCDIFASLKEVLFQISVWRALAPRTTDMSHMYSVKVPAGYGQSQLIHAMASVLDN